MIASSTRDLFDAGRSSAIFFFADIPSCGNIVSAAEKENHDHQSEHLEVVCPEMVSYHFSKKRTKPAGIVATAPVEEKSRKKDTGHIGIHPLQNM